MLNAFAAKRAVFARITADLAAAFTGVNAVQVAYTYPGEPDLRLVFGDRVRFTQEQGAAEWGVLVEELDLVDVVVQVFTAGDDSEAADVAVEQIVEVIADGFAAAPKLAGLLTWTGIATGETEHVVSGPEDPAITSILRLQVAVRSEMLS